MAFFGSQETQPVFQGTFSVLLSKPPAEVARVHTPHCPWRCIYGWDQSLAETCLYLPLPGWHAGLKVPWGVN